MSRQILQQILMVLSGVVLLFLAAPLISLLVGPDIREYTRAASDSEAINAITTTLLMAFAATLFFAVFGIPLAYLLARKNFRFKGLIQGMIDLPVVIPHTAAGIALLTVISPKTTIGSILESIGLSFVGTHAGIALAMAFVSVPFLINAARQGFEMIPVSYEKTSMSLGVSPGKTFFKISLPLARQSIINGMIMMFARGMSEFGAVVIIAYHPITVPTLIFERFGAFGLDHARPIAALFVLIALAVFILLRWFATKNDYA